MSYAIDLNPRQSTRTIEQAVRQQAPLILEPRYWANGQHLLCRFDPPGSPLELDAVPVLTATALCRCESASVPSPGATGGPPVTLDEIRDLVGTYVDAVIPLGEQRYLFSTDVLRALPPIQEGSPAHVHLTRPTILQVAQRRRFRRIQLSHSAQVEMAWHHEGSVQMGGVAWLFNISGNGMSARVEERIAESIWIGEEINLDFTLAPGDTERFRIRGTLCNKTPAGNAGKVILGIQFLAGTDHPESAAAVQLLRQRLVERAPQLADTQKGVDF